MFTNSPIVKYTTPKRCSFYFKMFLSRKEHFFVKGIVKYCILPTKDVLDIIQSTNPIDIKIIKGKYKSLSNTNIMIQEPIKYKIICDKYFVVFYEYNKKDKKVYKYMSKLY